MVSFSISELGYTNACGNSCKANGNYIGIYYYIGHWSIWGCPWLYGGTAVELNLFQTSSDTSSTKVHPPLWYVFQ